MTTGLGIAEELGSSVVTKSGVGDSAGPGVAVKVVVERFVENAVAKGASVIAMGADTGSSVRGSGDSEGSIDGARAARAVDDTANRSRKTAVAYLEGVGIISEGVAGRFLRRCGTFGGSAWGR